MLFIQEAIIGLHKPEVTPPAAWLLTSESSMEFEALTSSLITEEKPLMALTWDYGTSTYKPASWW